MSRSHPDIFHRIASGIRNVWMFYYTGFKEMTVGRTLWMIILVKLFIFFVVMKFLFFPNILSRDYDNDEDRAEHVRSELTKRNIHQTPLPAKCNEIIYQNTITNE